MTDMARLEQVKAETVAAEIGRLIAADLHWMAQRIDPAPGATMALDHGPLATADTRYTRLLRMMADQLLTGLEQEIGLR